MLRNSIMEKAERAAKAKSTVTKISIGLAVNENLGPRSWIKEGMNFLYTSFRTIGLIHSCIWIFSTSGLTPYRVEGCGQ